MILLVLITIMIGVLGGGLYAQRSKDRRHGAHVLAPGRAVAGAPVLQPSTWVPSRGSLGRSSTARGASQTGPAFRTSKQGSEIRTLIECGMSGAPFGVQRTYVCDQAGHLHAEDTCPLVLGATHLVSVAPQELDDDVTCRCAEDVVNSDSVLCTAMEDASWLKRLQSELENWSTSSSDPAEVGKALAEVEANLQSELEELGVSSPYVQDMQRSLLQRKEELSAQMRSRLRGKGTALMLLTEVGVPTITQREDPSDTIPLKQIALLAEEEWDARSIVSTLWETWSSTRSQGTASEARRAALGAAEAEVGDPSLEQMVYEPHRVRTEEETLRAWLKSTWEVAVSRTLRSLVDQWEEDAESLCTAAPSQLLVFNGVVSDLVEDASARAALECFRVEGPRAVYWVPQGVVDWLKDVEGVWEGSGLVILPSKGATASQVETAVALWSPEESGALRVFKAALQAALLV